MDLGVAEIRLAGRRIFTGSIRDLTQRRRAELLAEMGTLASGMAHEIGTPMNVILGRAEFIRGQLEDPRHIRYLDVIIEQGNRTLRPAKLFRIDSGLAYERYLIMDGGVSRENLKTNISVFVEVLEAIYG